MEVEKYKEAAVIRARSENLLAGEMPTKRSLSDENRHAKKNEIERIQYKGSEVREQTEIETAFFEHYKDLFSSNQPQDGFERSFLGLLPELEKETTERLEIPISVNEIEEAIDNLSNGKSPGPDGLGAAFYKLFKHDVALILYVPRILQVWAFTSVLLESAYNSDS